MDADLQAMVDAGKLNLQAAAALDQLKPHTFCLHKSWGFGQISCWNLLLNQIVVDFDAKKNHSMQLQYAAETLQPLPETHIFVRKVNEPAALRDLATNKVPQLIELVLESFGGKASQDQLQRALAPEIVSEGNFKKWWESAKRAIRKDGRFSLPAKKTEPITIRDESTSFEDEVIDLFQKARKLKDQLNYLDQILKNLETFAGKENELQTVVAQVEEIATRNTRLNPSQAIELLISRDELCAKLPELKRGGITLPDLLREHQHKLGEIISQVPANKQRRVLTEFRQTFPNDWSARLLTILQSAGFRVIGEIAKILVEQGQAEELRQALNRAIKEHSISSEALFWLCKERGAGIFAALLDVELMTSIISALERDQFTENRRASKLHDLLLEDRDLVSDLLVKAPAPQARDLMRRMLLTPAFEELNKRSLMARMIRTHPELQSMLTGDFEEKEGALVVSWTSLEKRKKEYDELVSKKIPENTREIGIARSYGDLRENFEYKAAKEMQTVLMRRKAELEQMLARARGSNFENADLTQVSIGTRAILRDTSSGEIFEYKILGAWDSDPEQHVVSYQTVIGQALLGKKPGQIVELPSEISSRRVEIVEIDAHKVDEVLA
ncbi:MAG: GreA/GreB family elongation factor [Verrucomicrobia bacterium]|nr:GreA/GreB family elongation factor [Verrucomicrobiota bacterium]